MQVCIKGFLVALISAFISVPNVFAATLDFVLTAEATGTAVFDSGMCDQATGAESHVSGVTYTPGEDSCADDSVVRTNDLIIYSWEYSSNGGDTPDAVITQTLPAGLTWIDIPPQCSLPGSSISPDGLTITCAVGTINSGTVAKITPRARVAGTVPNATILATGAAISGTGSATVNGGPVSTIVSAAPRWQIEKVQGTPRLEYYSDGTTLGYLFTYYLGIFADNAGKGTEQLASPMTLTDIVSYNDPVPNNSELYTWGPGGAVGACTLVGASPFASTNTFSGRPSGSLAINAVSARAVSDSGTITCSQAGGPGTPIFISISGTDSSLQHVPSQNSGGGTLPANRSYIVSDLVKIWVPLTDVAAGNAHGGPGIGVTNTYTDFDPDSISSLSNFGDDTEPAADNSVTWPLTVPLPGSGSVQKLFNIAGTKGTHRVLPGQQFESRVVILNTGSGNLNDIILCDKFDNTTLMLSDTANPVSFIAQAFLSPGDPGYYGGGFVIEYSDNANWSDATGMKNAACSDGDGPWVANPDTLPGGRSSATKVRAVFLSPLTPPGGRLDLVIRVKALPNPLGTVIPNFGSAQISEFNGGAWIHETVPASEILTEGVPVGLLSDRAILNYLNARVNKNVVSAGGSLIKTRTAVAGQTVTFHLQPTVTTTYTPVPTTTITLTDVLPADLEYVEGSAVPQPDSVVSNPNGSKTITWTVAGIQANTAVPAITFEAVVPFSAPNLASIANCVDISSPEDLTLSNASAACGSGARVLSSAATVVVSNPLGFFITKQVDTPLIQCDDTMQFSLAYRNVSSNVILGTDIIDILPFATDGTSAGPDGILGTADDLLRNPPSVYNGTVSFQSVQGSFAELFYYTNQDPGQIHKDPGHISNGPGGTTVWCLSFSGGSCPASPDEVTAVRIQGGLLPPGAPIRFITLVLKSGDNKGGDIYTNNFGARATGLSLPVYSPDVSVTVMEGLIGNQVFIDLNGNGAFEPSLGETGIAGVTLDLYADTNSNSLIDSADTLIATAVTDASGLYSFERLRVDDGSGAFPYLVKVTDTAGMLDWYRHIPGLPGIDSNSQTPNGYAVTLSPGALSNFTADFGYQPLCGLGDYVWFDADGDGRQGASEKGVPDVRVLLLDQTGAVLAQSVTNPGGFYEFTRLPPGTYAVQFIPPERYMFTARGFGTSDDSDADKQSGTTSFVTLSPGSRYLDLDAGLVEKCTAELVSLETHLSIDSGGEVLKDRVRNILSFRLKNSGQSCTPISKKTYSSRIESVEKLFATLWRDVWGGLPQVRYVCESDLTPQNCVSISSAPVKAGLSLASREMYRLGRSELARCKADHKTKKLRRKLEQVFKNTTKAIESAEPEVLYCEQ